MLLCTFCGYQNKNEGKFCTSCGNRLADESYIIGRIIVLAEDMDRQEYLISEAERYIGRDETNDIVISDDLISARHLKISFAENAFWLEDLKATNGTFVNGERIKQKTRLNNEDIVKIGRTLLQIMV